MIENKVINFDYLNENLTTLETMMNKVEGEMHLVKKNDRRS